MGQDAVSDDMLLQAIRRRLLHEAEAGRGGGGGHIVNNIYGQHSGAGGGLSGSGMAGGEGAHGVMSKLADEGVDPRDMEYFVDILRENVSPGDLVDNIDPVTGEASKRKMERAGWRKQVHRFAVPKKKAP